MSKEIQLNISGMSCVNCANGIEKSVKKIEGVEFASVNFANSNAKFIVTNDEIVGKIIAKIRLLGYDVLQSYEELENSKINHIKILLIKLIIAAIMGALVMYIEMFLDKNLLANFSVFLLSSVVIFYCGADFFIHAKSALKNQNFDMNVLIALGAGFSYIYSIFVMIFTHFVPSNLHHFYFSSASMIIVFVTLGKFLEERSKLKAGDFIKSLIDLTPKIALKISKNAQIIEVKANELQIGDIVIVKSGCNVPCDGEIIDGGAEIDKSFLTGESLPVYLSKGDKIEAGCINTNGHISIKVTKSSQDTMLSQILALISEANRQKMPISRFADKVANIFVPAVIAVAILTFVFWGVSKGAFLGLLLASSVLVISCPCALGLATPIAIVCAIGAYAKKGILIKNPAILENLKDVKFAIFDKTGTLTKGEISVYKTNLTSENLALVAGIENLSSHPISKAIVKFAKQNSINLSNFDGEFSDILGRGIIANHQNAQIIIGNKALLSENGVSMSEISQKEIANLTNDGFGVVLVAINRKFSGYIALSDTLKDDAKFVINELKKMQITPVMLTGDNQNVAKYFANELHIDEIYSSVLPQQKYEIVQKFRANSKVIFVGDGINDAAGLKIADISLAMSAGSDIAKESGDVIVINNDLKSIIFFIKLAKKTMRTIKQNLFWAFIYNAICIPVAAGILIPFGIMLMPMYGAMAMSISSLSVVLNSLKLRFVK